jgi:stalled ribosome rescue protein Dom34
LKRKRHYRRGHPVAVLVGFEETHTVFWNVFSRVVKPSSKIALNGSRNDEKVLYNFHELVIEKLKPVINEGVRSIVVSSPVRTTYAQQFLEHVKKHHRYMIQHKNPNCTNFAELIGSADDKIKVAELVKTKEFNDLIEKTTSEEADQVVESLEKHLYGTADNSVVLYSLKEIEDRIYKQDKNKNFQTEHLLLTDKYLDESRQKSRIHRLMQIAQNKKVKTKVVNAETSAGTRITQFGGIVFFTKK